MNPAKLWWQIPLSRENKERLKSFIFIVLPFIFRNSRVYRNWQEARIFLNRYGAFNAMKQPENCKAANPFLPVGLKYQPEPIPEKPVSELAIVIHAFHFEIFQEILEYLHRIHKVPFRIFVTSPASITGKVSALLESDSFAYYSITVENRGRDILPFLEIIPHVFNSGYHVLLKIHTKKTNHRMPGDLWRNDLYRKLLSEEAVTRALRIFNSDHTVGLIGAPGHIVPMNLYYGANARKVKSLGEAMEITPEQISSLNFSAGSMFYVRKQALIPLLNLSVKSGNFEDEQGQKDGTLAHAIERVFAVSALAANLKLVDITYDPKRQNLNITKDHHFTH